MYMYLIQHFTVLILYLHSADLILSTLLYQTSFGNLQYLNSLQLKSLVIYQCLNNYESMLIFDHHFLNMDYCSTFYCTCIIFIILETF